MNIALWFCVGGLLGWLMSRVLSEPGQEHTWLNLAVGLLSAVLAGWFLAPWMRSGAKLSGTIDFGGLVLAVVGALVALTVFNLLHHTLVRRRRRLST